jgi:hypothetical protein
MKGDGIVGCGIGIKGGRFGFWFWLWFGAFMDGRWVWEKGLRIWEGLALEKVGLEG